ncbi:hypothetical protein GCM10010277_13370 [Streptomyces longisporoflavus]|nr:hypothetical protein GCM10010277_13370 [Streptomyces longisporoflavus]
MLLRSRRLTGGDFSQRPPRYHAPAAERRTAVLAPGHDTDKDRLFGGPREYARRSGALPMPVLRPARTPRFNDTGTVAPEAGSAPWPDEQPHPSPPETVTHRT